MNVLLIGADGMLGRAVKAAAPDEVELRPSTVTDLDIRDAARVDAALAGGFDWVLNCAAWTRVDDAEEHEAEATRINGEAVGILGRAAARHGARVLHFSTDYVFDGLFGRPYREDDVPNLMGLYGGGPSFVRTMWSRARRGQPSRVVSELKPRLSRACPNSRGKSGGGSGSGPRESGTQRPRRTPSGSTWRQRQGPAA